MTVKPHVAVLFEESEKVYVTFVRPPRKAVPDLWVVVHLTGKPELSLALGLAHFTITPEVTCSGVVLLISLGHLRITGGSSSVQNNNATTVVGNIISH